MVNGVLDSPNGVGLVEAFHPGTGRTVWVQESMIAGSGEPQRAATRGVAYWSDEADQRIFVVRGQYLIALDAATGQPVPEFGNDGRVTSRPASAR